LVLTCALFTSLSLPACQVELVGSTASPDSSSLPGDRVWESQHFAYHARAQDTAICGDLLGTLERHFSFLQNRLGFDWPAGKRVNYYKFVDTADYQAHAPCPQGSGGCADGNSVYAYDAFEQHELVHAYLNPLGAPLTVVSEGAAVALACNREIAETPSLSLADAVNVRESLDDQRVYDTGGRLMRTLLDRFGSAAFLRFYAATSKTSSFADLDSALLAVYGSGANQLWDAALASPASCPPAFACARESLMGDGTTLPVQPVCGLQSDSRTFALFNNGDVAIAAPAATKVGSCDPIPFAQTLASTYAGVGPQVGLLQLAAGRYYLDFPTDSTSELAVLEPARPWAGSNCSVLQPFVVGDEQYETMTIALPRGTSSWSIRLRFDQAQPVTLSRTSGSLSSLRLLSCPDCDTSSPRCQVLDLGSDPVDTLLQGNRVLHVQSLSPQHVDRIQITRR
jgi:hypothetical protein